jgi:hypothetical protein
MATEKEPEYGVDHDGEFLDTAANKAAARRGSRANEATSLYGDVQTAEEYGYVARGCGVPVSNVLLA